LAQHYASADLFLYPSLTETFGNVVLEGMASGLPLVAFDYAAASRYIDHRQNGLLCTFGDEAGFLASSRDIARNTRLRQKLGPAARATAETIPWDAVLDRLEQDLLSALPSLAAHAQHL
jgi:glycosyltransferase involved in cell wall biosynthesis